MSKGIKYICLLSVALLSIVGCTVGLGSSVSYLPPTVGISYPPPGAVIRDTFMIKGEATDDGSIKSVKIDLVNTITKQKHSYDGHYNSKEQAWKVTIPNQPRNAPGKRTLANISDGRYEVLVTVTNASGYTSTAKTVYDIDNTPPLFVLDRPSTVIKSPNTDAYGAVFRLLGQAADNNDIAAITMKVKGVDKTFVRRNPGFNIDIAYAYDENNHDTPYTIFKRQQGSNSPQRVEATFVLEDKALKYDGKTPAEQTGGNKSVGYYLRSDVVNALEVASLKSIAEYQAGLPATSAFKEAFDRLSKVTLIKSDTELSTFTVNERKTPSYSSDLIGARTLDQLVPRSTGGSTLSLDALIVDSAIPRITLKPNLDGTPLVNSTYLGPRIFLREYPSQEALVSDLKNSNGSPSPSKTIELYDFKNPQTNASSVTVSQAGNTYSVTIRLKDFKEQIKVPNVYQLVVEGTDSSGDSTNKYEPVNANGAFADVDDNPYVLAFVASQNTGVPRVRVKRLENSYAKTSITIPFTVSSTTAITSVLLMSSTSSTEPLVNQTGTPLKGQTGTDLAGSIQLVGPAFDNLPEGENWASVAVANGTGSGYGDVRFVKDTTAPTIGIESRFLNDVLTGSLAVVGTLSDTNTRSDAEGSGIDASAVKAFIGKDKVQLPADSVSATSTSWTVSFREGGISQYGSSTFGDEPITGSGIYSVPLVIKVADRVGNESEKSFTLQIDPSGERVITEVITPQSGRTVGGRVQISGSAVVKNQNLGVSVTSVEVQISGNTPSGSLTSVADANTFFNQTWSDNDGKQWAGSNVAQVASGSIAWNTIIEAEKFIPSSQQTAKIYLRARGKNSNNNFGPWSKVVELTLDKGVPRIADAKINSRDYEYGTWISGDENTFEVSLYDEESGIRRIQMQTNFTFSLNGKEVSSAVWETANSGEISGDGFNEYFEVDTTHNPTASTGAKNYKLKPGAFKIPSKKQGLQQAKIIFTIIENKNDNALSTTASFTLRCDNTPPLGDFGDVLWSGVASFNGTTITDTNQFAGYPLVNSAKVGDKIFAQGKSLDITAVNTANHTLTVQQSDIAGSGVGAVLYRQNIYIWGSDYVVQGFCVDTGAGIAPTGITANIDSQSMGTVGLSGLYGSYFKWTGTLNSSSLNGQKHLVVNFKDVLGNVQTKQYNVAVKNTPFKVTAVEYKTDVNQNSTFSNEENIGLTEIESVSTFASNAYDEAHAYTNVLRNIGFVFTSSDKSEIKVTTADGKPGKYELKLKGSNTVIKTGSSWPTDGVITLNSTELGKIGTSGVATLTIWESDKPEGYGQWYTQVEIPMATALADTKNPAIFALPFYWNSPSDNSLKDNSAAQGHIEIRNGGQVPQISGAVVLKGSAYDDRLLKTLVLKIKKDSAEKATFTATYNKTNGSWNVQPSTATAGATLTVTTSALTTKGHFAEWSLAWDTATAEVGSYTVEVQATDDSNKNASDSGSVPSEVAVTRPNNKALSTASEILRGQVVNLVGQADPTRDIAHYRNIKGGSAAGGYTFETAVDETFNKAIIYPLDYSKSSFALEIVPYINKIQVNDSSNARLYWRTLQGHYPARADKTLTISGFNLGSGATYTIGEQSFTNAGNPSKSGAVVATVNGKQSINNTNNNVKLYNQIVGNQINGKTSDSDDMVVDVWEFSPEGKLIPSADTGIESIQMAINPSNSMVGIGYLNGAHLVNGPTKEASIRVAENNYDSFTGHAFIFKSNGETWGVVQGADMNPSAGSGYGGLINILQNNSAGVSDTGQNYAGTEGHRHIDQIAVLAHEGSGYEILKQRYKGFSFATTGNSTMYLAYYDYIFDHIKMRAFTAYPGNNNPNTRGDATKDNGGYSVIAGAFKQLIINEKGRTQKVVASTDRGAGDYLSLQSVGADKLAITWYNAQTNELWYAYTNDLSKATATVNTGSSTDPNPNIEVVQKNKEGWTAVKLADGGKYCKMIVGNASSTGGVSSPDDTAKIYIAYQTNDLKLGFIELAKYDQTTLTRQIVVDDYLITGQHLSLSQNTKNLPVIGYYAPWEQKARYAYPIGEDTSKWEVTVVPSQYRIGDDNVGVAGYLSGQEGSHQNITIEGLEYLNKFRYNLTTEWTEVTKIYGNNSGNSVLGYIALANGRQAIELAQMR